MSTRIRAAQANDLPAMYQIYFLNEKSEMETEGMIGIPLQTVPLTLRHVFETGTMMVAEQDGRILAFTGAITRGPVTFLTDLFVQPGTQSGGLGKALLQQVLSPHQPIHCTMSSTDRRAQALYIRFGMQPIFPHYNLQWQSSTRKVAASNIEVVEGQVGDPAFVQWDAQMSGRTRPQDHTFWIEQQQGVPLWLHRQGSTIGYAYVRKVAPTPLSSSTTFIGPLGVKMPEYATVCALAVTRWTQHWTKVVRIDVPGLHPSLAPLLESSFQIIYVETFHSTATTPFFDPHCYIPSGSDLL